MEKVGDGEKWGNWKEVSNKAAVVAGGDPRCPSDPLVGSLQRPAREQVAGTLGHFPRCAF